MEKIKKVFVLILIVIIIGLTIPMTKASNTSVPAISLDEIGDSIINNADIKSTIASYFEEEDISKVKLTKTVENNQLTISATLEDDESAPTWETTYTLDGTILSSEQIKDFAENESEIDSFKRFMALQVITAIGELNEYDSYVVDTFLHTGILQKYTLEKEGFHKSHAKAAQHSKYG